MLPDTTETVPAGAFSHSALLSSVSVGSGCAAYSSANGILYNRDKTALIACPVGYGTSVTIPEEVTTIAPDAFVGCELVSLVVLGAVISVDSVAFTVDTKTTATVVLPDGPGYEIHKRVWEQAGFMLFAVSAQPGDKSNYGSAGDESGGLTYELLNDYTLSVSWQGTTSPASDVVIPSSAKINGISYRVSAISEGAFAGQESLKSISVPSSVSIIGASAFEGCSNLVSASLSEGVLSLGNSVFESTAIQEQLLPASVSSVGSRAFGDCINLSRIVTLSDISFVAESAIAGCTGVSILVPNREDENYPWVPGISAMGNHVEPYGVSMPADPLELELGLTANLYTDAVCKIPEGCSVTFSYPASYVSVAVDGVISCKTAGSVDIAVSLVLGEVELVRALRSVVVRGSSELNKQKDEIRQHPVGPVVQTPRFASELALRAAAGETQFDYSRGNTTLQCTVLTLDSASQTGTLSVAVKNTTDATFDFGATIKENGVTYTVTAITAMPDLVSYARSFTSLVIPAAVETIGDNAFVGCALLETLDFSGNPRISSIGYHSFERSALRELTVPSSVKFLGGWAFGWCFKLQKVVFENSNTVAAFVGPIFEYSSASEFTLSGSGDAYIVNEGALFTKDMKTLLQVPPELSTSSFYVIPEGVEIIGAGALCGAKFETATIPSSVREIRYFGLANCLNLKKLEFAENSNLQIIQDAAFTSCKNLKSVIIPASTSSIATRAFNNNTSLSSVVFEGSESSLRNLVFCDAPLTSFACYGDIATIEGETAANPVGTSAFKGVIKANVAVSLPDGVVCGRTFDQRKKTWIDAGFTNVAKTPDMVAWFDSQGGSSVIPQRGSRGFSAAAPADPQKANLEFRGWYENAACTGSPWDFSTSIDSSVTLYAKWTAVHTVSFNGNGGNPSLATAFVDEGKQAQRPVNPTWEGHTFQGWYTARENGVEYEFSSPVTKSMTLYASWKINEYTVSFYNGVDVFTQTPVEHGKQVSAPKPVPDMVGYEFGGWFTDSTCTNKYDFVTPVTGNLSLYAKMDGIPYTVSFGANKPYNATISGGNDDLSMVYDIQKALPSCGFVCAGYAFIGWNTVSNGSGTSYSAGQAISNLTTESNKTIVLYAQWKGDPYTVSFDANAPDGASAEGTMADVAMTFGVWSDLPGSTFKCAGYLFRGWTTDKEGKGRLYLDKEAVQNIAPQGATTATLYAQWDEVYNVTSPIDPTVSIDAQGNISPDTRTSFRSNNAASVSIDKVTCIALESARGIFPECPTDGSLWTSVQVTLADALRPELPALLPINGSGKTSLVIPGNAELPVIFGLKIVKGTQLTYDDTSLPIARLSYEFSVAKTGV